MFNSAGVGWGVSKSLISGLVKVGKAVGSFKALIKSLNSFKDDNPKVYAA